VSASMLVSVHFIHVHIFVCVYIHVLVYICNGNLFYTFTHICKNVYTYTHI